jgi:hypothetical protein
MSRSSLALAPPPAPMEYDDELGAMRSFASVDELSKVR